MQVTHGYTLSHYAWLLHATRPSKLLHVLAEVTLSTLGPEARLALSAACPSPPGSGWAAVGWQLNGGWRRCCWPHLGLRPVGRTLLEGKQCISNTVETVCQWRVTNVYLETTTPPFSFFLIFDHIALVRYIPKWEAKAENAIHLS